MNGHGILDSLKAVGKVGSAVISGNVGKLLSNRPKVITDLLRTHGDKVITSVVVMRKPIVEAVAWILKKTMSFGEAVDKLGYDNVFHLFANFYLNDGSVVAIQKNARIDVAMGGVTACGPDLKGQCPPTADTEELKIPVSSGMSLNQLFDEAEQKYGGSRLYFYDARSTNCQRFIADMLTTLGAMTPEASNFILQDAAALLTKNEGKFAKAITNIAGVFDYIQKGGALAYAPRYIHSSVFRLQNPHLRY